MIAMQLTKEDVSEFATVWRKEFNEALSDGEARHKASQLMELYSLLARVPPVVGGEAWTNADPSAP